MTTIKGLPVFTAEMDETCGMTRVALVDFPAVEKDFLAFAEQQPMTLRYAVKDEEKRLIFGVLMRANFPIYREDKEIGGFWLVYKPETLRVMAEKYLTEGRANNVNLMHEGAEVEGVQMVQFFIKDAAKGVAPAGFDDVEDGSLFGEFHVTNDEIWAGIKAGTFKGFSIETVNYIKPATTVVSEEKIDPQLLAVLSKLLKTDNSMSEKLKNALTALLEAVGLQKETAVEQKFGAVTTDKAVIHWEGDEDLSEGDAVFVEDENGERRPAEDGDYTTEDGKVIQVADGKVAAIVDDRAEVSKEGKEETAEEKMARITEAFAMSYGEKTRKIYESILSKGYSGYIVDAGDDFAILSTWNEAGDHFMRFGVSWTGDEVTIGEPAEVFSTFVTADELRSIEEAKTSFEAMKAELQRIKAEPKAKPAHEEFQQPATAKTGNAKFDHLRELGNALR